MCFSLTADASLIESRDMDEGPAAPATAKTPDYGAKGGANMLRLGLGRFFWGGVEPCQLLRACAWHDPWPAAPPLQVAQARPPQP